VTFSSKCHKHSVCAIAARSKEPGFLCQFRSSRIQNLAIIEVITLMYVHNLFRYMSQPCRPATIRNDIGPVDASSVLDDGSVVVIYTTKS
jgi:hypothetical protein